MKKAIILSLFFSLPGLATNQGHFTFDTGFSRQGFGFGFGVSLYGDYLGVETGIFFDQSIDIKDSPVDSFAVDIKYKGLEKHLENYRLGINKDFSFARLHFGGFLEYLYTYEVHTGATTQGESDYYRKIDTELESGVYLGFSKNYKKFIYGINLFSSKTAILSLGYRF